MIQDAGYSRREQWGWYCYDWANSAFYTSVVTVFLGPYITSIAKSAAADGHIYPFSIPVAAQSLWPYLVSLSVLSQVIFMPLVGAIADYGRRKRELLGILAFTGAGATIAMYWLDGGRWAFGSAMFLLANLAFGASIVLYNSFLPEIAPADARDSVSSTGWGFGYLGGGILLALHLFLFSNAEAWGLDGSVAVRIALGTSGLWWAAFTLITIATLRNRGPQKSPPPGQSLVGAGVRQLGFTLREVIKLPQTLLFLVAYLIYNDAIQTVIAMAAQFGSEELHLDLAVLTSAILLTQIVAFGGALAFNQLAARIGSRHAVMAALVVWVGTLIYAYLGVKTKAEFYAMAAVIGVVLGGSQALSRSIFSFMIPKGHEAEYYSVYEISDKGTSWLGPLFFGLALQWTGSFRVAILSLIIFFLGGLVLLARVDVVRAAREAGNEPPAKG
jgi:UMF1 family MFS transporter